MERWRLDEQPARAQRARCADVDLRNASRLVATQRARRAADVPRYRRSTRGISVRERLHARRAVTDHRAPVLWVVGVPDHRLLRADRALRNAAGLHVPHGHAAPAWRRCDPGLGSVPLSDGRAWTRLLRRHASLRARRSAAGVSPGL